MCAITTTSIVRVFVSVQVPGGGSSPRARTPSGGSRRSARRAPGPPCRGPQQRRFRWRWGPGWGGWWWRSCWGRRSRSCRAGRSACSRPRRSTRLGLFWVCAVVARFEWVNWAPIISYALAIPQPQHHPPGNSYYAPLSQRSRQAAWCTWPQSGSSRTKSSPLNPSRQITHTAP